MKDLQAPVGHFSLFLVDRGRYSITSERALATGRRGAGGKWGQSRRRPPLPAAGLAGFRGIN
jgi:hypothetical protein